MPTSKATKATADYEALQARVQEQAERVWDVPTLKARIAELSTEGIPARLRRV